MSAAVTVGPDVSPPGPGDYAAAVALLRNRVPRGEAGYDLVALLLDLHDANAERRPPNGWHYERWLRGAGFADYGPEVES